MLLSPEERKKALEEISKLPPKERIEVLERFEADQSRAREEEKKKQEES